MGDIPDPNGCHYCQNYQGGSDRVCGYLAYLSPIRDGRVNEYWNYIP